MSSVSVCVCALARVSLGPPSQASRVQHLSEPNIVVLSKLGTLFTTALDTAERRPPRQPISARVQLSPR